MFGRRDSAEVDEAAKQARAATAQAADSKDEAQAAAEQAADAKDEAQGAAEQAADAKDEAQQAAEYADAASDESQALLQDLLVHPDHSPDENGDEPFGTPGDPISRHTPFYVGFVGTLGVLLALLLGIAIREASSVLFLVLISMFLAVGLNPIVEWLIVRGFRRRWSVLLVTFGVLVLVTLFMVALVPVVREQVSTLITNGPALLDELQRNRSIQRLDGRYDVIGSLQERLQDGEFADQAFGSIFSVGLAVLSAVANAFMIFVLTLYFLSALPSIKRASYAMVPESRRTRVTYLGDEILRRVGGYVAGAFLVALSAGVSSFVFLEIVGLREYAVALALLVAIFDFIPLIGATIGATIVSIIGFANSPTIGIACIVFFIAYQQFENYVLYPRIMSSSVNVPGVVTVVAVLIGGSLMGVVGAMMAIPLAAAVLLLVREVWLPRVEDA